MKEPLTEYSEYPGWIDTLTPEEVRKWYEHAKWVVALLSKNGSDVSQLVEAIKDYELRHNINEDK